jgi:hypothetical protein
MTSKAFHIGDILTACTGVFCTPNGMGGLYDILNWMTGRDLLTHQLPEAGRECRDDLRRQHPDLAGVSVPQFANETEGLAWIAWQVAIFGETREVAPLNAGNRAGR